MKRNCKRLTALILAMAMSLSMLSSATWATDVSVDEEEVTAASLTTDAEEPTDDEEEDASADAASEAAEEPTTEEAAAEESTEEEPTEEESAEEEAAEPAEEPAEEESTEEEASEDEAEAEVTALEDEAEEESNDEGEEEEDYSVGNGVAYTLEDGVLTIYRTDEEDQDGRMWDWGEDDSPLHLAGRHRLHRH